MQHFNTFHYATAPSYVWFSSFVLAITRNLQQSENKDTKLHYYELACLRESIWDGDLKVRIRQQKLLRRVWWQNNKQVIVASPFTVRVSKSVQRISTCAAQQRTRCTETILALKTIWKKGFWTPHLPSHQQNSGAQLTTCQLCVALVYKPKEIISSTIFIYSE